MHRSAHRGILIGALLLLAACGGGKKTTTTDALVGGLWTGTLTVNGIAYDAHAMSAEDGDLEVLETDPDSSFQAQYWGTVSAAGDQLSGTISGAVLNQADPFSDGSFHGTGTVSGTIQEHSSITAMISFTTSLGTAISGQLALTYDAGYEQPSALATIAGNYTNIKTPGTDVLSISSAGDLSYTDPLTSQCTASGTVTIIDATYSVYAAQMSFSNCTNAFAYLNGVSIQGLANVDSSTSPRPLLLLMHGLVSGLDTPFPLAYQGT
jgi:hypothetical protein